VVLAPGCSSDESPTEVPPPGATNLPEIPIPSSPTELLPAVSEDYTVGLSDEIEDFTPLVTEVRMMRDDGSTPWVEVNRRLILACASVLPENTGDPDVADRNYVTAHPRRHVLRSQSHLCERRNVGAGVGLDESLYHLLKR